MKMKRNSSIILVLIALTFVNCKKGDTGPAGKDGTNGNANVSNTSPFTINNFVYDASSSSYQSSLTLGSISQGVVDGGVVMVYFKTGNSWVPLPFNDDTSTLMYEFYLGGITFYWFNHDGSTPMNPNGSFTVRAVVIPSQIVKQNPTANWNDYSEMESIFDL